MHFHDLFTDIISTDFIVVLFTIFQQPCSTLLFFIKIFRINTCIHSIFNLLYPVLKRKIIIYENKNLIRIKNLLFKPSPAHQRSRITIVDLWNVAFHQLIFQLLQNQFVCINIVIIKILIHRHGINGTIRNVLQRNSSTCRGFFVTLDRCHSPVDRLHFKFQLLHLLQCLLSFLHQYIFYQIQIFPVKDTLNLF